MTTRIKAAIKKLLNVGQHDARKVLWLCVTFFLLIGAYTVTYVLKDAVFTSIVGSDRSLWGYAKLLSMAVLVPAMFFHSRLVDLVKRQKLLYIYSTSYTILGFIFVALLGHPTIGLPNNISSPSRIFGWLFYFFIELYVPLVVSVFWSFANSITKPESAKNNYPLMIAASKFGGILLSIVGIMVLASGYFSDVAGLQILLGYSSAVLGIVPFVIFHLVNRIPKSELHGYEAGYQLRKESRKHHLSEKKSFLQSIFSGLMLLFEYPYVMGIFGMSFFFELISQVLKVENILAAQKATTNLSSLTSILLWQQIIVHAIAFGVVLFGTRAIITFLGERRSLIAIPLTMSVAVITYLVSQSTMSVIFAYVVTKAVNYAFATPLIESLYIPTVKEIQFKSKNWIDGFGKKFSKTCAMTFNSFSGTLSGMAFVTAQASFFSITFVLWVVVAYLLGWRFETAVKNNEVIGADELEETLEEIHETEPHNGTSKPFVTPSKKVSQQDIP